MSTLRLSFFGKCLIRSQKQLIFFIKTNLTISVNLLEGLVKHI